MADIFKPKFPFVRRDSTDADAGPRGTVTILPTVRIESYASRPRAPKRGREARRALQELQGHVRGLTCALAYLKAIAREWPDPRAVAALLGETDRILIGEPDEREKAMLWAVQFLGELRREVERGARKK